ncbi:hypothetical protein [Nocardiopsis sp. ATB16-24]|uniref:hypothetical protein n=1 Tax=Nocardiopsis sp. ATB16-24 TaxID=3019555 RepID=UPI0025561380|nr:hypothetical protein [Nocardiopsis sp. ATB16-24]
MTLRDGRVRVFPALALSSCLALSACSTPEPETEAESSSEHISLFWVEREARVLTLDRMFAEGDPETVVESIGEKKDRLLDSRIIREDGDGYVVELDKDEWRPEEVNLTRVDGALGDAMYLNEVTWCGETVTGEEFVDDYMEEFWETLDNHEEYTASIADYVDCGDGRP